MCLTQGPQRSDPGEAQINGLSVSSQVLYQNIPEIEIQMETPKAMQPTNFKKVGVK